MNRAEIEEKIAPIIESCRLRFAPGSSETSNSPPTLESLRPDIRRVSLIASLASSVLEHDCSCEALEVGSGFGCLIFPMASLFPKIRWSAIDHPSQPFAVRERYRSALRESNCELVLLDLVHQPLPFSHRRFSLVTLSEVLEHLPTERLRLVLSEIARTIQPGGILIASSPNQASLENRLQLLRGKSILDMPDEFSHAPGLFGHIRLYTPSEMQAAMAKAGLNLERCVLESNNSGYRGDSESSWRRRIYRAYERVENKVGALRQLADTWYMVFRKTDETP
jgi:2-polyprenyl-3-methyl-5-hydroxy-6-metoxy-1,4-benzoquinol methylase